MTEERLRLIEQYYAENEWWLDDRDVPASAAAPFRFVKELCAAIRERDARIAELEDVLEAYAPNHPVLEKSR